MWHSCLQHAVACLGRGSRTDNRSINYADNLNDDDQTALAAIVVKVPTIAIVTSYSNVSNHHGVTGLLQRREANRALWCVQELFLHLVAAPCGRCGRPPKEGLCACSVQPSCVLGTPPAAIPSGGVLRTPCPCLWYTSLLQNHIPAEADTILLLLHAHNLLTDAYRRILLLLYALKLLAAAAALSTCQQSCS